MPSNKPGSRLIRAAGGVAWRPGPDGSPQVLLVHRKKYDDWSLPKGKIEPGEPLPVTAVREVLEEGGARLALGRRLVSVRYNVGGRPKRVHYWAARVLSIDSHAIPNAEVDEVAWLPAERAVEKVSYPHDHGVLADFAARPPQTVPLILLRHAKALPKGNWKRADADRPLDDSGRYAAKDLADLLACFSPHFQLITSPAARCAETLRPLSELTGDPVREEPTLYIHHEPLTGEADPRTVNAALIRAAIESGKPTVVCAHRENMAALREAALTVLTGYSSSGQAQGGKASNGTSSGRASNGRAPNYRASNGGAPNDRASNGGASNGKAARGKEAADSGARGIFELPRDWDETLPTSGFWVLNIGPLPADAEAEAGPGSGPAPEPDLTASDMAAPDMTAPHLTAPAAPPSAVAIRRRTWWPRLRALTRRGDVGGRPERAHGHAKAGVQVSVISTTSPLRAGSSDDGPNGVPGVTPGGALAGDVTAARPVGVLISADRYDPSELAES